MLEMAHRSRPPFERIALIAPMIDLANLPFPNGARWLADTLDMVGLGAAYIPFGGGRNFYEKSFEGNKLTTDPARFARNAEIVRAAPALVIGDPTIGWVNAAFRQMARFEAPEYARAIRTPILMYETGRESIVSNVAIERFVQNLNNGALVPIPGAKHELLMERDEWRALFWRAFDAFIPGERPLTSVPAPHPPRAWAPSPEMGEGSGAGGGPPTLRAISPPLHAAPGRPRR